MKATGMEGTVVGPGRTSTGSRWFWGSVGGLDRLGVGSGETAPKPNPVILTVDDEPQVLQAIARDLQARYRKGFRILRASSGREALEGVTTLKSRGTRVALFLVDQRMPEMSGVEFLAEAIKIFPCAKKVLFTAYADIEAVIAGINHVGLDYYLLKLWDPPEELLYPVLDDLLSRWREAVGERAPCSSLPRFTSPIPCGVAV